MSLESAGLVYMSLKFSQLCIHLRMHYTSLITCSYITYFQEKYNATILPNMHDYTEIIKLCAPLCQFTVDVIVSQQLNTITEHQTREWY